MAAYAPTGAAGKIHYARKNARFTIWGRDGQNKPLVQLNYRNGLGMVLKYYVNSLGFLRFGSIVVRRDAGFAGERRVKGV